MRSESAFSYSSQPQPAPIKRKNKYRDAVDTQNDRTGNLMFDSRVARGNTYSTKLSSSSFKSETQPVTRRPNRGLSESNRGSKRSSTPPAMPGRMHMEIQTENFLEELTDKNIEIDAETQTQAFLDRPASPLFVPAKTGVDAITQIDSTDLFDFDAEVAPILEVLVGKTLHVAMLELMQEEELQAIYRQQEEFNFLRSIELAEVQRLEAEAKRKTKEKSRRIEQEHIRAEKTKAIEEKVAAQYFASQYLGSMHTNILDALEEEGHFYDPLQMEIEDLTIPDLLVDLRLRLDYYEAARLIADELLAEASSKAREFEERAILFRHENEIKRIKKEQETALREMEANRVAMNLKKKQAELDGEDSEHDDW